MMQAPGPINAIRNPVTAGAINRVTLPANATSANALTKRLFGTTFAKIACSAGNRNEPDTPIRKLTAKMCHGWRMPRITMTPNAPINTAKDAIAAIITFFRSRLSISTPAIGAMMTGGIAPMPMASPVRSGDDVSS